VAEFYSASSGTIPPLPWQTFPPPFSFEPHLAEVGIGSISEVFDAEPPFTPRGCVAQAWSVAEVLRCLTRKCCS
jgi:hypothetical protein